MMVHHTGDWPATPVTSRIVGESLHHAPTEKPGLRDEAGLSRLVQKHTPPRRYTALVMPGVGIGYSPLELGSVGGFASQERFLGIVSMFEFSAWSHEISLPEYTAMRPMIAVSELVAPFSPSL